MFLPKRIGRWLTGYFHKTWHPAPFYNYAIPCGIDYLGIWFIRRGDEICWLWPWRRRYRQGLTLYHQPWLNINVGGCFLNLADIDRFWQEYSEARRKAECQLP